MNPPTATTTLSHARHLVAALVCTVATAQATGAALWKPSMACWNDVSRWCTVWSLLERGTYAIDGCPWEDQTKDKIYKPAPFQQPEPGAAPVKHFYSSKPALLPTLIAGVLYPFRLATGVPLDEEIWVSEGKSVRAAVLYFKPIIILGNVVPFGLFLFLYARLLDRCASTDWSWYFSLFAAAWGTQLMTFTDTLNNHSLAAFAAFFAIYPLILIYDLGMRDGRLFAMAGFFGAFCACNELPAALFGAFLFAMLLSVDARATLAYFLPAAAVPAAMFALTQYLALGNFSVAYANPDWYQYEGSAFTTAFFDHVDAEAKSRYLFHMLLGHHGVVALTPVLVLGGLSLIRQRPNSVPSTPFIVMTIVMTVAVVQFYVFRTHDYGGNAQTMRWLMWLFPFWLTLLPRGVEVLGKRPLRRGLAMAALFVSAFSGGYALQGTWTNTWISGLCVLLGIDVRPFDKI